MPSGSSVSITRRQTSEQIRINQEFKGVTDRSLDPTTGLIKIILTGGGQWSSPSGKKDLTFSYTHGRAVVKTIDKAECFALNAKCLFVLSILFVFILFAICVK